MTTLDLYTLHLLVRLNKNPKIALILFIEDEDGTTLLEIITDEDYDLEGDDIYMLYPLVSVLTEGQKACIDFLSFYQIVSIGINDDAAVKGAMKSLALEDADKGSISIYEGVDRSIFSDDVAMTTNANNLQQSTDKDMTTNWFSDGISLSTKVLFISLGVSVAATIGSFVTSSVFGKAYLKASREFANYEQRVMIDPMYKEFEKSVTHAIDNGADDILDKGIEIKGCKESLLGLGGNRYWQSVFKYVGIGLTVVSLIIMGVSIWRTYEDLKAYYNVDFSPIPKYMVDQGVNDKDEKVFTYYTAAVCNRQDAKMVNDKVKLLKDFGDINGDVGKQWVALYTTKDRAAGNPVTIDFITQCGNANIPGESTALSLFGEKVAQNLTNAKGGFTYADGKNGIYLFYNTDSTAFAGSAFSNQAYALIAGGSLIVLAAATFFIVKAVKNKKKAKTNAEA